MLGRVAVLTLRFLCQIKVNSFPQRRSWGGSTIEFFKGTTGMKIDEFSVKYTLLFCRFIVLVYTSFAIHSYRRSLETP